MYRQETALALRLLVHFFLMKERFGHDRFEQIRVSGNKRWLVSNVRPRTYDEKENKQSYARSAQAVHHRGHSRGGTPLILYAHNTATTTYYYSE